MKTFFKPLLLFLLGFIVMGAIYTLTRCSKDDYTINPDELKQDIDLEAISKAAAGIEDAFAASDQTAIDKLVMEESLAGYRDKEEPYSSEELAAIGNALKDKELTTATTNFAEYTYSIDGKKFTIWMGREADGAWKIIRY